MKKLFLFWLGLLILVLSYSAFASIPSIPISGGHIDALGKLYMDFSKIESWVDYRLHCSVAASDKILMNFRLLDHFYLSNVQVNGRPVSNNKVSHAFNLAFRKGVNNFVAIISIGTNDKFKPANKTLEILNLDDKVTVDVENCSLTPTLRPELD